MKKRTAFLFVAALLAAFTFTSRLHAQPLVNIETVTVGDPGNPPDSTGYGSVGYAYRIGKYEVTIAQYTAFLNSVAKSDPYNLYNNSMGTDAKVAGIVRTNSSGFYRYSVIAPAGLTPSGAADPGNRPISYVSWPDAARFCNWLHNGATNGASTETGAYTLSSTSIPIPRNPEARFWIPTADEWFKAAYYRDREAGYWEYPMQSDAALGNQIGALAGQANYHYNKRYLGSKYATTQTNAYDYNNQNFLTEVGAFHNSPSPHGTFDQGGNVREWIGDSFSTIAGGCWDSENVELNKGAVFNLGYPYFGGDHPKTGFRVAATAESVVSTSVLLSLQKTTDLSDTWQNVPMTSGMMTQDGEIIVGQMTNTNEFYRLKIRTVVE